MILFLRLFEPTSGKLSKAKPQQWAFIESKISPRLTEAAYRAKVEEYGWRLTAIEEEGPINRDSLRKILQLYELSYRWQSEDQGNEQVNSLSFTMIIANNLGEIHRAVGNHSKLFVMCLQYLLSSGTMMSVLVVDCNDREEDSVLNESWGVACTCRNTTIL